MQTLTVNTPSHSYPIYIDDTLTDQLTSLLPPFLSKKAAIISNTTVAPLYMPQWQQALNQLSCEHFSIILPDGESYKNSSTLNLIYDGLLKNRADRQTTVIALGGGVIGDMAGFAAASYQRGLPFIQVPTTLLSQVDSSVGGKTGINHPLGKNMIGAFYQPEIVIADLSYLSSLPTREFSAGMAEVIKYAVLGDIDFLGWLENNIIPIMKQDPDVLSYAVHHCCKMKADIVAKDEKEQGIRAYLNLGHTFGHVIETYMGYGNWLHGEAVSAGIVLACQLSAQLGHLSTQDLNRVIHLLNAANLPTEPPIIPWLNWQELLQHDKKVQNNQLRFIILQALGQASIANDIPTDVVRDTLQPYLA